jgi:transcriptional regulator with XRE-family HTH domain
VVDSKLPPGDHKIVLRQGSKILHLRRERGLTQAELSRGICTQAALSNYEHGIRQLPILVAMRIANRLGISVDEIAAA